MKKNYTNTFKKLLFGIGCVVSLISVNANAQTYCSPSFRTINNTCDTYRLRSVTIGSITNAPAVGSCTVSDYTAMSTTASPGQAVSYSVNLGNWMSFAIYADFNKDGDFNDTDELLLAGRPAWLVAIETTTGTITIPATVATGSYRMRIVGVWGDSTAQQIGAGMACNNFGSRDAGGNFHDYTLNVAGPAATAVAVATVNNVAATITTNAGTLPLAATVTPTGATQSVTWSVITGAEFASVSATGVVTAIKNGTATIKATSTSTPAISGTINVVITNQVVPATSVVVTTLNDVAKTIITDKGTLQLVGTVSPADATDKNVTWSITTGSEFATVSATGLVTAIKNGTVTVKATSVSTPAISGTTDVVITNQITKPTSIVVATKDEAAATITTNAGTLALVATVAPDDATDKSVTWAVTTGAEFATVSADGVVTAIKNGTVTVTATAVADATVSDAIEIVITNQIVATEEVVVSTEGEAAATISAKGGTLQLIATVTPDDDADKSVTWSVSKGEEFASVSATGLVTAILNGAATIRATSVADTSLFDEIEVTVTGNLSTQNFTKSLAKIYPNPTTGIVYIQSQEALKQFAVFNMLGQQVTTGTANEVNLANVQNGVYLLEVTLVNGQKLSQKIIKN